MRSAAAVGVGLALFLGPASWLGQAQDLPRSNAVVSLADDLPVPEEAFVERSPDSGSSVEPSVEPDPGTSEQVATVNPNDGDLRQSLSAPPSTRAEENEAMNVDNFEDQVDADVAFGGPFFGPALNLLSPTEPGGRDNLLITFGSNVGYDTNVLFDAREIASGTATGSLGIEFLASVPRLDLAGSLNTAITVFENRPGGDRQNTTSAIATAAYKFRPRITLNLRTSTSYQAQPDPEVQGGTFNSSSGSYVVTDATFDLNYEWRPRLNLVGSYVFNAIRYDDEIVNDQSGFVSQTLSLSTNYLLNPRSVLLGVVRYNGVSYAQDGQGSDGIILLLGLTQTVSPRFEWTLRAGAEFRKLRNPDTSIEDLTSEYLGPFVEGETRYRYSPTSQIVGTLRYGTEPSGVSGFIIRQAFRLGIANNHQYGPRLSSRVGLNYEISNYDQPGTVSDYSQTISSLSSSLRYQLNPTIAAVLTADYLIFESELPNSNYTRGYVTIGFDLKL